MELAEIKNKQLECAKDGDVIAINGVDLMKFGDKCARLKDILAWEGLERLMYNGKQITPEVVHTFSGGIYIREMRLDKGTFIIGKRHRHETCNILMSGTITVYLGDGKPVTKISGPTIITSDPMIRKIAYCHDDAVFLNIHPTNKTDINEIEKEFIITEDEFRQISMESQKCLGEP